MRYGGNARTEGGDVYACRKAGCLGLLDDLAGIVVMHAKRQPHTSPMHRGDRFSRTHLHLQRCHQRSANEVRR